MKKQPKYLSSKGYYDCLASLRIVGNRLDFKKIERLLKLKPEMVTKRGEVRSKVFGPSKIDVWSYKAMPRTGDAMSKHLSVLAAKLVSRQRAIRSLAKEYKVEVYCSYISDLAQGGFTIPPKVQKVFSECNLPLAISILSWGGVIDDKQIKKSSS